MKFTEAPLSGVLIIEPRLFTDARGYFHEAFQAERYAQHGIPTFVQDNLSRSNKNVLRGLHYQKPHAQGKLVHVSRGAVWDVVVDIRASSPTFGKYFYIELSEENHLQLYIPPGFAHGFCVLSDVADFHYKCTDYYHPESEHGIAWNDPSLNIPWPIQAPVLSPKDEIYAPLKEIKHDELFA